MKTQIARNTPTLPSFPYFMSTAAIILTISTLILFTVVIMLATSQIKNDLRTNRIIQLHGSILYLDEVLTMSANMAATTGNLKWESRYHLHTSLLDKALTEFRELSPEKYRLIAKEAHIANTKLLAMEQQSFTLVKQGKLKEAQQILLSPEYEKQKNLYFNGMKKYLDVLQIEMINDFYTGELTARIILFAILMMLALSLIFWILFYNIVRRRKIAFESIIRENIRYEEELETAHAILEEKVSQRTEELKVKNQELSVALDDLHLMQKNIVQSEKMSMIGQLSAGIAHEINNPLSFVMSNIGTLRKRLTIVTQLLNQYQDLMKEMKASNNGLLEEKSNKIINFNVENKVPTIIADFDNIINESSDGLLRIKNIVANLGTFSADKKDRLVPTSINTCIENALEMVRNKLKYKIEIHKNLAELPTISGSPDQLKIVFMNLLLNAADSIKEKGNITIVSKVIDSHIEVTITDNGCGIASENLTKIFNPFFTTKPIGEGMGLGLATAYGIIQQYGGNLSVESTSEMGSTFLVRLPLK